VVWAAEFGGLEWHPWTSPTHAPHCPLTLARLHGAAFEHLGVVARPKVTGRRGIQIWVPVTGGPGFDETRGRVQRLSRTVGAVLPDLVSWKWYRCDRAGRRRLDLRHHPVGRTQPREIPRSRG
jgi:bifunctional non-homologous end joining protein LigD